jgi:large subunit ribosomal protein L21
MSANYAIIHSGGKQYRVRPGDTIQVEKLSGDAGSSVEFTDVLMTAVDGNVTVGKPKVDGARVTGEISAQGRGPKAIIYKYMAKTRRRRIRGHRQPLTTVTIKEIASGQ